MKEELHVSQRDKDHDIRVEVIAALAVEDGIEAEFYFHPQGIFARNFRKDILEEYIEYTESGVLKSISWELSREGLYDMLPEGLFHQPMQRKAFRNTQEMIQEFKRQQKEEENARNFFLPVEQSFYEQRISLELEELRAMSGFMDPLQQDLFSDFWGLEGINFPQLRSNLLNLLPLAHRIAGDLQFSEQCFEAILGIPIRISKAAPEKVEVDRHLPPSLGEANLGLNLVLGNSFFDYIPSLLIHIGPVKRNVLRLLLPGNSLRRVLDLLCKYFLPCEVKNDIFIEMDSTEDAFILEADSSHARLGFTTRLAS